MQNITPCLWFNNNAEEAAKFYVSVFPNSKMGTKSYYTAEGSKASGQPKGSLMCVDFTINGNEFLALNGGPVFKLSEAVSFMIRCKDQKEIDYYWDKLTKGGEESVCGWLKDKFGLSWQLIPADLEKTMKDPKKYEKFMKALMKMRKPDLKKLEEAGA